MQTKFKKGDRVRAVKSDAFGVFKKGDEGEVVYVDYKSLAIDLKRGKSITISLRGAEDVFELIEPSAPRLASEMTLREYYAGLALNAFLNNSDLIKQFRSDDKEQNNIDLAKSCALFADALIQSLNEKP